MKKVFILKRLGQKRFVAGYDNISKNEADFDFVTYKNIHKATAFDTAKEAMAFLRDCNVRDEVIEIKEVWI